MSELEKLNIVFPEVEKRIIKFESQKVEIKPYITIPTKTQLIREYIYNLFDNLIDEDGSFNDLPKRYLTAEYALTLGLIDLQTSVTVNEYQPDEIFSSELWNQIKGQIVNYERFRFELNEVLELTLKEKSLDKSVGSILETVADKTMVLLQKISEMDVESLRKVAGELGKQAEQLGTTLHADKPIVPKKPVRKPAKAS